jgi:hypothetical protein
VLELLSKMTPPAQVSRRTHSGQAIEPSSPVRSQAEDDSDAANSQDDMPATQLEFSTQVLDVVNWRKSIRTDRKNISALNLVGVEQNSPDRDISVPKWTKKNVSKSNDARLLSLLVTASKQSTSGKQGIAPTPGRQRRHTPGKSLSQDSMMSVDQMVSTQAGIALNSTLPQPVSEIKRAIDSAQPHSKANSQSSRFVLSPRSLATTDPFQNSKGINEIRLQSEQPLNRGSNETNTENSELSSGLAASKDNGASECVISNDLEGESKITAPVGHLSQNVSGDELLFVGKTRILRKYCEVPRDQRDLLEREDSWYYSTTGTRSSYAKIPLQVLEGLQNFHTRRLPSAQTRMNCLQDAVDNSDDNSDVEHKSDGDFDLEALESKQIGQQGFSARDLKQAQTSSNSLLENTLECKLNTLSTVDEAYDVELEKDSDAASDWSVSDHGRWLKPSISHLPTATPPLESPNGALSKRREFCLEPSLIAHKVQDSGQSSPIEPTVLSLQAISTHSNNKSIHPSYPAAVDPTVSSSAAEDDDLELEVPYAIDDTPVQGEERLTLSSNKDSQTHSTKVHPSVIMQVERTPHVPRAVPYQDIYPVSQDLFGVKPTHCSVGHPFSSNPVIPNTFEGAGFPERVEEKYPSQTSAVVNAIDPRAEFFGSSAPLPEVGRHYHQEKDTQEEPKELNSGLYEEASSQKLSLEFETCSQNNSCCHRNSSPRATSPSYRRKGPFEHNFVSCEHIQSCLPSRSRLSSQECSEQDSQCSGQSPIQSTSSQSQNNRRAIKTISFGFSQDSRIPADPSELSKANRHKFLNEASITCHANLNREPVSPQAPCTSDNQIRPYFLQVPASQSEQFGIFDAPENVRDDNSTNQKMTTIQSTFPFISNQDHTTLYAEDPFTCELKTAEELVDQSPLKTANSGTEISQYEDPQFLSSSESHAQQILGSRSSTFPAIISSDGSIRDASTIFMRYGNTYPEYHGSMKSFIKACVYIEWLLQMKMAPHPSLWDDFIRAFSEDYSIYIRSFKSSNQKPMSGLEYYNTEILDPIFTCRILNPTNLGAALLLDISETNKIRKVFYQKEILQPLQNYSPSGTSRMGSNSILENSPANKESSVNVFDSSDRNAVNQSRVPSRLLQDGSHVERNSPKAPVRRPFFETTSQVTSKGSMMPIKSTSPPMLASTHVEMMESIEMPYSDDHSPNMARAAHPEMVPHVNPSLTDSRCLPQSSQHNSHLMDEPSGVMTSVLSKLPAEDHHHFGGETKNSKRQRKVTVESPPPPRLGSPILGSQTPEEELQHAASRETSPTPGIRAARLTGASFQTPGFATMKLCKQSTASTQSAEHERLQRGPLSVSTSANPRIRSSASSLKRVLSYEAFIRSPAYKRLKRRSGGASISSTPASTPSNKKASWTKEAEVEDPETQAFSFQ